MFLFAQPLIKCCDRVGKIRCGLLIDPRAECNPRVFVDDVGLSGILCSRRETIIVYETLVEDDGELRLRIAFARCRFHSAAARLRHRYSKFVAASSFGKWPLARTARRNFELSASIAFVV